MILKLQNPLKEISVNQWFGKNANELYKNQGMLGHNGIDYHAPHGTPIYAAHDGFASYQVDSGGGHGIVIVSDKEYEGIDGVSTYWKTIYWHIVDAEKEPQYRSPIADKFNFPVKAGDLIAYADNTGVSTGSHLHFGLKPVAKGEHWGTWYNTDQNNGYYGAVDPRPYLPPVEEFKKYIKRREESLEVQKLQAFFIRNGYMQPVTAGFGYYGPKTQAAVKQFQIDNGIKHNEGLQVGPKTISALNQRFNNE